MFTLTYLLNNFSIAPATARTFATQKTTAPAAASSSGSAKKTWGLSANYLAQKNGVSTGEKGGSTYECSMWGQSIACSEAPIAALAPATISPAVVAAASLTQAKSTLSTGLSKETSGLSAGSFQAKTRDVRTGKTVQFYLIWCCSYSEQVHVLCIPPLLAPRPHLRRLLLIRPISRKLGRRRVL